MLADHTHVCQQCGAEQVYHVFAHESKGDTVDAYCGDCGEDTPHTIGELYA